MTELQTLKWIKDNLGAAINIAIAGTPYTEDWLGAMCYRETGNKIIQYVSQRMPTASIHELMKGDYGQRPGEKEKSYHGFGYWQIDIASYPLFVKSGNWKDPNKCAEMCRTVLDEKRLYLLAHNITAEDAITAAYNCGQGNVVKAAPDWDKFTHQHNYSAEVRRLRSLYLTL